MAEDKNTQEEKSGCQCGGHCLKQQHGLIGFTAKVLSGEIELGGCACNQTEE